MVGNNSNELDPIAFWVLLLLSGGQRLTVRELMTILNRTIEVVWRALQTLKNWKYVKDEKGKYMITHEGIEYLTLKGVSASEPDDEPAEKDFIKKIRPPYFSSWTELMIWLTLPLVLLAIAFAAASIITLDYNFVSLDKRIYQTLIFAAWIAFVVLYLKFSHHNIMENERLVVFRSGKVIGKKGPGHAFLLPLVDNPKKVDLREKSKEINKEPCITKDNLLIHAGFYISWQIDDPILSLTRVSNVEDSMTLLSTAVLRATLSEYTLEDSLRMRKAMNTLIRNRIEQKIGEWGAKINNTEIRELHPPDGVMKRIEDRFNASLESEAALTKSDAHVESLRRLMAVGAGMDVHTFNLKYLETLEKIGEGESTKYIIPMEFFHMLEEWIRTQTNRNGNTPPGNGNNPPGQLPPSGLTQ